MFLGIKDLLAVEVFGDPWPQEGEWETSMNLHEKAGGPYCWFKEFPPLRADFFF